LLKCHEPTNFGPESPAELETTPHSQLRRGQRRQSIIAACSTRAGLQ
jgi:hypothetical protein